MEVGRHVARALDGEACLDEISRALLQADVPADLVHKLSVNVKNAGNNTRSMIQQAVLREVCALVEPAEPAYTPIKGRQCVVMFIGLQGSGKTTSCTKYAHFYKKKGWKPSLVCADTFKAGAFEQLKQNAAKADIPFFGNYSESDPVTVAKQGIAKFKKENSDLIIVDMSGQHRQQDSLFEGIREVSEMTSPELIILVMDSNIGQAAYDQVQEFRQNVSVGAVILTKMDGHAKGVGALISVAAAKTPVIFLGIGEHMDEFEWVEVKPFVSQLLRMGEEPRFLDKIHDVVPTDQQPECIQKLYEGSVTLRKLYHEFQSIHRIYPLDQLLPMGIGTMPRDRSKAKDPCIKKFVEIMDSMSDAELDSPDPKMFSKASRINGIARRSGHTANDVHELLEIFRVRVKFMKMLKARTAHG